MYYISEFSNKQSSNSSIPTRYQKLGLTPNKPVESNRPGKKKMVLASKRVNGKTKYKLVHYGASGYGHNYSPKARKNYLKRSAGIKGKGGRDTTKDKFSPNHWARKDLWSRNTTPYGTGRLK